MTLYHTKLSVDLVNKYPNAGVFTPMGVGIYQNLNDDTLHVSVLTSQAHEKILGIDKCSILKDIESQVLSILKKAMPNANYKLSQDPLGESRELLTKYELTLEEDDDAEEIMEELQMTLESSFKPKGFVVPKILSFDMDLNPNDADDSIYEFFTNYSICKLEVIYTVAKTRPDAAAFAPCTTMIYKKRDENKIVMGFPSVYNWMSSALVNKKRQQQLRGGGRHEPGLHRDREGPDLVLLRRHLGSLRRLRIQRSRPGHQRALRLRHLGGDE
jgi:uncharacterized protein (DUF302 family)